MGKKVPSIDPIPRNDGEVTAVSKADEAGRTSGLRVALIGASSRGLGMGAIMARETGSVIVGVADPVQDALQRARRRLGDDTIVYAASDAELYGSVDCDAVIIASGDPYHVDNVEAALARGKHIFLEKPIAQRMEDLQRLVDLWNGTDRVLMVGLELRQCAVFKEMKRLLDEGAVGRVIMAQAFDNVSVGGTYFYHNQYRNRSHVRSLVLQKGTHTIDLVNWFVAARPTSVFCLAGRNVYGLDQPSDKHCRDCAEQKTCRHAVKDVGLLMDYGEIQKIDDLCVYAKGSDVDDNSLVLIDYDSGARAFYGECHFTPEYTREFTLIGNQGKMTGFYNNACEFRITVRRVDSPTETRVYEPRPTMKGGHGGSDPLIMIEFARRVREHDRGEAEFREIVEGTAIAIAATDSAETGRPVTIPQFR